jgi:hypothetical protein
VQGRESDAILTVKLNDMGHYGCSSDCTDKIAVPLHAEATVQLIRRRSMSSLLAHSKYQHFLSATRCIFFSLMVQPKCVSAEGSIAKELTIFLLH